MKFLQVHSLGKLFFEKRTRMIGNRVIFDNALQFWMCIYFQRWYRNASTSRIGSPFFLARRRLSRDHREHEVLECSVNTSTVQYGTVLYWVLGAQFYVPNLGVASSGCFQYQKQVDMLAKGQQIHKREFSGPPSKGRLLSVCQPQTWRSLCQWDLWWVATS